jgi:hypothetical protein
MNTQPNNLLISVIISILLVSYGIMIKQSPISHQLRNLFNNAIFRVVFLSTLVVYGFRESPHIAITIALLFVLSLQFLKEKDIEDNFKYYEQLVDQ